MASKIESTEVPDKVDTKGKSTANSTAKTSVNTVLESIKSVKISKEEAGKLAKVVESLPEILSKTDNAKYDEIYGYRINVDSEKYVDVNVRNELLLKFLIANNYDVEVTKEKLVETLNWRNKFQPLQAGFTEEFDEELNDLGAITEYKDVEDNLKVITWNLYGNLKTPQKLFKKFGDEENGKPGTRFLRWRVGLMERALVLIDFTDPANHKIAQVHDYKNASMFRPDPGMKSATKEIISLFGNNYPELLSIKFFINVPTLLSYMYGFLKFFISEETYRKFKFLNSGNLTEWFGKKNLPRVYGGDSEPLREASEKVEPRIKVPEYGQVLLAEITKGEGSEVPKGEGAEVTKGEVN